MSDDLLEQLGNQIGADKQQTATAANGVFASILGGLANNASSEGGLSALSAALDRDHDGSILDDVLGMVGGMMQGQDNNPSANGMGILNHVLGGQQEAVAQQVGQKSGLDMSQVMKLMPILAPIVMGVLGKAKKTGGLDLGNLAGVLMGSAQNAGQQSGMGDILGNILGSVMTGQQQPQGSGGGILGSILGGIFGKR
ncbi:MAG: DUF937 domain-containing protein [Lewinellaceae bacterium]|nr:DUF937 domain-containing protein [Lewinellaceae bacterium]